MKIIIAGAGEVGTHLAKMLSQEKQDIILMDPNEERLNFTNSSMEISSVEVIRRSFVFFSGQPDVVTVLP